MDYVSYQTLQLQRRYALTNVTALLKGVTHHLVREFRKWIYINLESSVSRVIRLWAECLRNRSSILGGG